VSFIFYAEVGFREFDELMLVRSFWLGVAETSRPELCPGFFEVDLAPCILKFLRRDDGRYFGVFVSGTNGVLCTVYHWLASVLPLLLAVEALSFVEPTRRTKFATSEQFIKDGPTQIVLGASMTVFRFCLYGLKVLWPKSFEGKLPRHDIDYRSNELIAQQATGVTLSSSLK
jgi:hypothetical protein